MTTADGTGALIEVSDASFAYDRGGRFVVDAVSLAVTRGSIVGILGPNGSGKTTLLRLLAGTIVPNRGGVTFDGSPLASLTRRELARRVAIVPQETHSTFDFSALEIVLMGRYPHLARFELEGANDIAIARAAMTATDTAELENRRFSTLSGGEKQRVVIASALAQASDVLLLDEPTASLDPRYQIEISELLVRLNRDRGTTMVVSTHDLNLAAALCREVVLIKKGRLLGGGALDDTLTPANIRALYGIDAEVAMHARAGHLTVVPIGRAN
jgi:iron complex transport system ATP-binding protein